MEVSFFSNIKNKCFVLFPAIIIDWEYDLSIGFAWLFWSLRFDYAKKEK